VPININEQNKKGQSLTPKQLKAQEKAQRKAVGRARKLKLDLHRAAVKRQENMPLFPISPESRFEVKHTYKGLPTMNKGSFEVLSQADGTGIQHLLVLNRQIYQGDILPFSPGDTANWIKRALRMDISIIDTKVDVLTAAVLDTKTQGTIVKVCV